MATLVVVDDETMNAETLAFLLEEDGHKVYQAADGREGVSLTAEVDPDLIITDYMMPVMTGVELATALKADPVRQHLPIILLTATQASLGRQNPELFAWVFEKPCRPVEVLEKVREILEKKSDMP